MDSKIDELKKFRLLVDSELTKNDVVILPPMDVHKSVDLILNSISTVDVTMLDPWYNKGTGGVRDDYVDFVMSFLTKAAKLSKHVFL